MPRARTPDAKDERRQQLLEAALDEFYERGFAAARMEDIARRAQLSKGAVYLYFSSKEELFRALIETFARPNLEHVDALMDAAPTFDEALGRLAAFAPAMIRARRVPKLFKIIVGDSQGFPDLVRTYREEVLERLLQRLGRVVARAVEAGEIAPVDPALTARLILAPIALSGLWQAVFARDDDAPVDLETLLRLHAETLSRALARESRP